MARTLFALLLVCLMLHANAQTSSEKKSVINMEKKTIKQDAGRKQLGDFAPKFAELNDDVLFGQVWNRQEELSLRDRSLNGITRQEIAEVLTHIAFYAGWPKAWAAFRQAKEVWADKADSQADAKAQFQREMVFPIGEPNIAYAKYFIGQSYLAPVSTEQIPIHNVTFEPGCRNNWHIHHATKGGGQLLVCVAGRGWYQEWGKPTRQLLPGDVVNIPANVKQRMA